MAKRRRKLKKGIIFLFVFVLIIVSIIAFYLVAKTTFRLNVSGSTDIIEVLYNDDTFEWPSSNCELLGKEIPITREGYYDVTKLGEQSITYTCEKFLFKESTTRTIKVVDKDEPVIYLAAGPSISIVQGGTFDTTVTASDIVDGDLSSVIVKTGEYDPNTPGEYDITYTVKDSSGNSATATQHITVRKKVASDYSCGNPGVIYLTFDDGPSPLYTADILDILKKYDVKATFFVTSAGPDELIKREFDEGHAIGLHSSSHAYERIYTSSEAFWNDMNAVGSRVERITGQKADILRFPGGSSNTVSRKYSQGIMTLLSDEVERNGYAYYDWNISSGDAGGTTDPNVEYQTVISNLSKSRGNVVLMHDIKKHTRDSVENMIKYGLDNGYTFDKLTKSTGICHQRVAN